MEHIKTIGDIEIYADLTGVLIYVDDECVLSMMRHEDDGLKEFVKTLNKLIIKDTK